jgi:hypothetical protein
MVDLVIGVRAVAHSLLTRPMTLLTRPVTLLTRPVTLLNAILSVFCNEAVRARRRPRTPNP